MPDSRTVMVLQEINGKLSEINQALKVMERFLPSRDNINEIIYQLKKISGDDDS
ncbi:MAG: hypothetical protein RX318_03375 [bacterium]|nr:hypothetical protein [bacterium]